MDNAEKPSAGSETGTDAGSRVDPILEHLHTEEVEIDKSTLREAFVQLWEYEKGDSLSADEQYLTQVAVFIYTGHNFLDDHNIRTDRARGLLVDALKAWDHQNLVGTAEAERGSENPFQAFVDNLMPKVDEIFTWKRFLLDHKKTDAAEWTYKMKKCWFHEFFVRLGRPDLIETACKFDQVPWEARKDFVDLKLNNMFSKLGTYCQFCYKPAKKNS